MKFSNFPMIYSSKWEDVYFYLFSPKNIRSVWILQGHCKYMILKHSQILQQHKCFYEQQVYSLKDSKAINSSVRST